MPNLPATRLVKVILLLCLCLPHLGYGEIYQWHDQQGKKHFSDRPHADAKLLQIKPSIPLYKVKTVYDGDTILLEDGRRIRLLGINTPEIQHKDKLAEAGGEAAKAWLLNKLQGTRVRLESDVEQFDKYGRTLAYIFSEKKEHLNVALVQAGLAATSIYPPNLKYAKELMAAEKQAEHQQLCIWQRPEYQTIAVTALTHQGHPGWTRLRGRVQTLRTTSKSVYLVLSERVEVRIERRWLHLFSQIDQYPGKTIEVRGWLRKHKQHFSMPIRHPSAIKLSN